MKRSVQWHADKIAREEGVNPAIFRALVTQESGWNEAARSPTGAIGETQLEPGTARSLGVNPYKTLQNLRGGARYLAQQLKTFGGDYKKALAAYNAGPGAVEKYGGVPPFAETQAYVSAILSNAKALRSQVTSAGKGAGGASGGGSGASGGLLSVPGVQGAQPLPAGSTGVVPLLQALAQQKAQPASSSVGLAAPSFAAGPKLAGGAGVLSSAPPVPKQDTAALLQLVDSISGGDVQNAPGNTGATVTTTAGGAGTQSAGRAANLKAALQAAAQGQAPSGVRRFNGVAQFDGKPVAAWIAPVLTYAKAHGWKGSVTSGYRSKAQQQSIYSSGVRPAAKPGTSNHEFTAFPGGAVDVSQAAQLSKILRRSPYANLLVWAGGKDPVHFSHPHNGGY